MFAQAAPWLKLQVLSMHHCTPLANIRSKASQLTQLLADIEYVGADMFL